eukprot:CAMPEP_0204111596 /NCGR_PEP_ID=MMETSP0361-20130328/2560_1 /ASSEMBLY_ACC=CAM_ASM_000343 /TAXON_ID=268821 /ORGANISM="Scrippsiella Hangoei, Strain SHTV-5" /LENGTH=108 /DNA_ID=CAMNT_0051061667 /DNA_START=455 /DNA_END=778 /DNA_ORIENTATION=+
MGLTLPSTSQLESLPNRAETLAICSSESPSEHKWASAGVKDSFPEELCLSMVGLRRSLATIGDFGDPGLPPSASQEELCQPDTATARTLHSGSSSSSGGDAARVERRR